MPRRLAVLACLLFTAFRAEAAGPEAAILSPAHASYVGSLAQVSGTASADLGVATVTVALSRQSDGYYWDGSAWVAGQTWLAASVFPSSWTYSALPALVNGSTYAVQAVAIDGPGTWSSVAANIFYYDSSGCYFPVRSVNSGSWTTAATWSRGIVPTSCSDIVVSAGHAVTLNIPTAVARSVTLEGSLSFTRSAASSLRLAAGDIKVLSGGTLDMGTPASPIPANITATLILSSGPYAGRYGLIVEDGGTFSAHGAAKSQAAYAVQPILDYDDYFKVYGSTSVQGWQLGDLITIGPVSGSGKATAAERTLFFMGSSGALYTVYWSGFTLLETRAPSPGTPLVVTNLTRNVLIRSSGTVVDAEMGNSARVVNRVSSSGSFSAAYAEFAYLGSASGGRYGFVFEPGSRGEISSSTFRNGTYGLALDNSSLNTLRANIFYGNSLGGLLLVNSSSNTVSGGYSIGNSGSGISLYGSSYNALSGNRSFSNSGSGFSLEGGGAGNSLEGGAAHSNSGSGLWISSCSGNTAAGAEFYSNAAAGVSLDAYSSGNLLLGGGAYANYGPGARLTGASQEVFQDARLGYDRSGASRPDAGEVSFSTAPASLVLKGSRVNPAADVAASGRPGEGAWLLSYGQYQDPGTLRLWGDYRISGSTLALDYSERLYAAAAAPPRLMRGAGHAVSGITVSDTDTLSELIKITNIGGGTWRVEGSSSGVLGSFSLGASGSYSFSHARVSFTLTAGPAPAEGDSLHFAVTAASGDAAAKKSLLFGPASAAFDQGRSRLEVAPGGGLLLRGKPDGTGNTLLGLLGSGSTYYTLVSSGAFTAVHSSFTNMYRDGLQLSGSGGVEISSSSFDYLGFAAGSNSYITARDLVSDATFYNVSFGLSRSSAGYSPVYNVKVEGGGPGLSWHLMWDQAGLGPLWGEAYDSEEGDSDRVKWGDIILPDIAVLQPPDGQYVNSLPEIHGTSADDAAVSSVTVSLSRASDGFYWDGSAWGPGQAWITAALHPSSWSYSGVPPFADGVAYTAAARAMDTWGNWSAVYATSTFVYDAGLPVSSVTAPARDEFVTAFAGINGTAWDAGSAPGQVWVRITRLDDGRYWDGAVSQWTAPEAWNLASGTAAWTYSGLPQGELTSWTSYYAVSRAQDLTGNVETSDLGGSTFTFVVPPPLPGSIPAPSGTVLGTSSIAWTWAAADEAVSYNLYSQYPAVLLGTSAVTAYTQAGLTPDTTYSLEVAGLNFTGEGPGSGASEQVRTLAAPPAGLSTAAVHATSVTLAWGLNGNPAGVSARVLRVGAAEAQTQGLAYTSEGLLACTSYYFRVWNVSGSGIATAYQETGPVLTRDPDLPQPGGLFALAQAGGVIALSWEHAPYEGITGYNIYYDNGSGTVDYGTPLGFAAYPLTSYSTPALVPGVTYKFGLRAAHRCGVEDTNTSVRSAATALAAAPLASAVIKVPQTGKRVFGNSVMVMAEPAAGTAAGIREVRLQYKPAAGSAWTDITPANPASHPNPDPTWPYFIHWDVTFIPPGRYDLRAVAADLSGAADSAPPSVTVDIAAGAADADIHENSSGGEVTKNQVINNLVAGTVYGGDPDSPQVTRLEIPAGALDYSTSVVSLVNNPAGIPAAPAEAWYAGLSAGVTLAGQTALAGGLTAEVVIFFPDADADGVLDGTNIRANQLRMYSAPGPAGPWSDDVSSAVDAAAKKVTGRASHFSYFGLFARKPAGIDSARAYPVPWRPGSGGRFDSAIGSVGITFDRMSTGTEIRIFTVSGRLVRELEVLPADLGLKVWDGRNSGGAEVASGVYLVHLKNGSSSRILKIAVER